MPLNAPIEISLLLTGSHVQFAAPNDTDAVYSVEMDADTLAYGELVEVIIEQKFFAADGAAKRVGDPIYIAGPAPPTRQLIVSDFRTGLRITAKQTGGTFRTVRLVLKPIA